MAQIEITIEQLMSNGDWAEVFADENSGNVSKTIRTCPVGQPVSDATVSRADVAEIIAAVNGDNDGPDWLGLFKLKDGRFLVASGGCNYTGWDCQAGNSLTVCATLDDALKYGMSDEERTRLELVVSP